VRNADDPLEAWREHFEHGAHDRVRTKRSVSPNPPTPPDPTLAQPLGQSLLAERENRVNPGGSQRWDQAREYGNYN
jgi:hypothetical protein